MNWIFTVVFSGLLFSSNSGTALDRPGSPQTESPGVTVTKPDETERFDQTYPLTPDGRLSISNVIGSITVEAWDRNEVHVIADKTADSKERLQQVEIRVNAKPDSVTIETNYDNWKQNGNGDGWKNGSKVQVEYHLMVPRGAVLNEIETVNGGVTISNFTNFVKVSAVNGTVTATNLRGTASLSTVNGEVSADFGSLDTGSKISLSTVNGKVNLTIPSDASATIRADSLNGNILNDFGLPVRKGKYIGRDLYGKLGNGDVRIKVDSVNGDLRISRQNDGKTPGAVTDLLQQKDKDDEDWDKDDGDQGVKVGKVNKDVALAIKESQKASSAAVAEARTEIEKAAPEIGKAVADSAKIAADTVKRTVEVMKSENVQRAIEEGMAQQKAALAKIADAIYYPLMPRAERKSNSFSVRGVPKVTVETHRCSLRITGWDKSEVKYAVTQLSSSHNHSPLDVKESHDDSSVTIGVEVNDDSESTRIEIFVPRRSNLRIKADSEIRLDGVSGEIELTGEDGAINVRDVDGTLSIVNTNGRVRVIGFKGDIQTETFDGMTMLEGDFAKLSAKADTGSITVTIPGDAAASINTVSPGTNIEGLPLVLVRENEGSREYRLGNGGPPVKISTKGTVLLRSTNSITTVF